VEQAMPFKSSAITIASPSINGSVKFVVLGVRSAREPFTLACGTRSRSPVSNRSRNWKALAFFLHARQRQLRRLSQARDAGDVFGAGAAVALGMPP